MHRHNDSKIDLRSDLCKSESNPFVVELKGRMFLQPRANTIVAKGQEIINIETGEVIQDSVLLGRRKIVDKSKFAKVYADGIRIILDLNKPAVNVLSYIMEKMDFDNKVYINTEKDSEKMGYKSSVSVIKGLKDLIAHGVIAPAVMPSWYWVNPLYVCKGERFAMYTEYVTQERHDREMAARGEAERRLREQGVDTYDSYPEEIQNKLQSMSEREERLYYSSKDLFTGEETREPVERKG